MKNSGWFGKSGALALALVVAGSICGAPRAEESKPASEKKIEAAKSKPVAAKPVPARPAVAVDSSVTITNEDLERMFGPSETKTPESDPAREAKATGEVKPKEGVPADDPLKAMDAEKKNAADRQEKVASAEKALADAEANLKNLEARLLATKNPYLPRPQLTPEEAQKQAGTDNAQRVSVNEQQIREARAQVEKLRAELGQAQPAR